VLFHLAGSSGLRAGELFGLRVEDLDLKRGLIRVRRSVWRGQEVTPKTRKGYRDVFIDSVTVQMIVDYLGSRTAGRIFETRNGTPLDTHNVVRQVLKPICKPLGIAPGGMHAFRHGRVSHLQQNGAPADFTKKQVGHSSLRTTNVYTHFSENYTRELVERMASESSWTHSRELDSVAVGAN
jgi:integrase